MLERGDLSARRADLIAEASWSVLPDVTDAFETTVLQHAPRQSPNELGKTIQRAAIAVDPAIAERRRHTAHQDRTLTRQALPDGIAELRLTHTTDAIESVYQRIDAATRLLPARDHVCVFPNCNQPAHLCQVEHCVPFNNSGSTRRRTPHSPAPATTTAKNPTHHSATPSTPTAAPLLTVVSGDDVRVAARL
jgi:hypothetical protein